MYEISFALGALLMLGVLGSILIIYCIRQKSNVKTLTEYRYDILEENIM